MKTLSATLSGLPTASMPVDGTELIPLVQGGVAKTISLANLTTGDGLVIVPIEAFGGAADSGVTDNSTALRSARDWFLSHGYFGYVYFHSAVGYYGFQTPVIFDAPNVGILGDGRDVTVFKSRVTQSPVLALGINRSLFTESTHYVDANGLWDAATGPGQFWAYNLNNDAYVTFPASPFELGPIDGTTNYPRWETVQHLTFDVLVKSNTASWSGTTNIFGCADDNRPEPCYLIYDTVNFTFAFMTTDGLIRQLRVPVSPSVQTVRLSMQIDLSAGTALAWVNNVQVSVDTTAANLNFASGGLFFVPNYAGEFVLGANVYQDINGSGNFTLAGLTFSVAAKYANNGIGTAQTRLDARPVNDSNTYAPFSSSDIACVQPATAGTGNNQLVKWHGTTGVGYGLFYVISVPDNATISSNTVRDVQFSLAGGTSYGAGVWAGANYNLHFDRCYFTGGARGISSVKTLVSYTTRVWDCLFTLHSDCSVLFRRTTLRTRDNDFESWGRQVARIIDGDIVMRDTFIADTNYPVNVVRQVRCQSGGHYEDVEIDQEGMSSLWDSYFYVSPASNNGFINYLVIKNVGGGLVSSGKPYIRLVSHTGVGGGGIAGGSLGPGYCLVENAFSGQLDATAEAVVDVDGPLWQGKFVGVQPPGTTLAVNSFAAGNSLRFGYETVPAGVSLPPISLTLNALSKPLIGRWRAQNLGLSDGAAVTSWTTILGQALTAVATGSTNTYKTNRINGLATVSFAGADLFKVSGLSATSGGLTAFFVLLTTISGFSNIFDSNPAGGNHLWVPGNFRTPAGPTLADTTGLSAGSWANAPGVVSFRLSDAPGRIIQAWANQVSLGKYLQVADTAISWSATAVNLGGVSNTTPYVGEVAEVLLYDGGLTDVEVAQVQQFLINEYQLIV